MKTEYITPYSSIGYVNGNQWEGGEDYQRRHAKP